MASRSIFIGFDGRETSAFVVARESIEKQLSKPIPVYGLVLQRLIDRGLYWRSTEKRINPETGAEQLWDVISDAPAATEFSNSRWLVPRLADTDLAVFLDCDMLVRCDLNEMFDLAEKPENRDYPVMCVKHNYQPTETVKMDGVAQTRYARKNWSSVVLWRPRHPANAALTLDFINDLPGRDLHAFCWLKDDEIGELPVEWNWLAGISDPTVIPRVVHHTEGTPAMRGYENAPYADEWWARLYDFAEGRRT